MLALQKDVKNVIGFDASAGRLPISQTEHTAAANDRTWEGPETTDAKAHTYEPTHAQDHGSQKAHQPGTHVSLAEPATTLLPDNATLDSATLPTDSSNPDNLPYPEWLTLQLGEEAAKEANLQHHMGHELTPNKPDNHLRVEFNNIGNLPIYQSAHSSRFMIDQLAHYKTDVYMLAELGWNIPRMPAGNSWFERSKTTLHRQSNILACNKQDTHNTKAHMPGGTGIIALEEAQPRVVDKGVDDSGLGRWTWMRFQGRDGHFTRMISAYRPCRNSASLGTVYRQQMTYWSRKGEWDCPLDLFDKHLEELLALWKLSGDRIILGIDANEDIRSGKIHSMTRRLGMQDAILDLHDDVDPPETCNKNTKRVPTDGIFVTPGIMPTAGGYSAYGQTSNSDHRTLWIDIPFTSVLGFKPPNRPKKTPRRLNGKNPKNRDTYNKLTKKGFARANKALPRMSKAQTSSTSCCYTQEC